MDRTHADDFSGRAGNLPVDPPPLEFPNRFPGAEKLAGEVDIDNLLPLLQGHLLEWGVPLDSGIIHQDIDGSEMVQGRVEHAHYIRFYRHIRLAGNGPGAAALYLAAYGLGRLRVGHIVDQNIGTGVAKGNCHGLADA